MTSEWKMLADLLRQARAEMAPNVSREAFAKARGGSGRIMADLETAARNNYDVQTIVNAEVWYGLEPGQIREFLQTANEFQQARADVDQVRRSIVTAKSQGRQTEVADLLAELASLESKTTVLARQLDEVASRRRTRPVPAVDQAPTVGSQVESALGVLLDIPDEALVGLSQIERDEVVTAARLAALSKAREIRGNG